MTAYVTLLRSFIFRGLAKEKTRAVLTILGIALGVAVSVAIQMANEGALSAFRAGTEAITGHAHLEISSESGDIDERVLENLLWLGDHGSISPILEGFALLPENEEPDSRGMFLRVLGVDILRDRPLRDYELMRFAGANEDLTARQFLELIADPHAIVITEKLARSRGLEIGDEIPLVIGDRKVKLEVKGLLLDSGPARVLDGGFALMDIAAFQMAWKRLGRIDRIDLLAPPDADLETLSQEIAARLPPPLVVQKPDEGIRQTRTMIRSFHFNLSALGSLALLVGLYLIYNTSSFSVVRRRREIGRLRALGTSRQMIFGLFIGEAFVLAAPGTVIGLLLGKQMAFAASEATSATVRTFYIAEAARETVAGLSLGWKECGIAFGVALPLALMAALWPAFEATRISPARTSRGLEDLAGASRSGLRPLIGTLTFACAALWLVTLDSLGDIPVFGYLAVLCVVFAGSFATAPLLRSICRASDILWRITPGLSTEGLIASRNLRAATARVSICVAALAIAIGMTVSIAVMVGSFRQTVIYWLEQTLSADILVRPAGISAPTSKAQISSAAIDWLQDDRDVEFADQLLREDLVYRGRRMTLAVRNFDALASRRGLLFKEPEKVTAEDIREAASGDVLISESLALRYDFAPGDSIDLPTASGDEPFRVAAIFYDYSDNQGVVLMDSRIYLEQYGSGKSDPGATDLALYLRRGVDAELVKERLEKTAPAEYSLIYRTNAAVLSASLEIFDSTFSITYALQVIAATVAAMVVISTLITLLLERRREIALLFWLGASRRQIRRIVVIEALLLGVVGQVLGLILGLILSLILIYVINVQSFGWTIQFRWPVTYLIASTIFVLLGTSVAGLWPARFALRGSSLMGDI